MFFLEVSTRSKKNLELVQKVMRIRSSHILRKLGSPAKDTNQRNHRDLSGPLKKEEFELNQNSQPLKDPSVSPRLMSGLEEANSGKKILLSSIGKNTSLDSGNKSFSINNDIFLQDVFASKNQDHQDSQEYYNEGLEEDAEFIEAAQTGYDDLPPVLPPREMRTGAREIQREPKTLRAGSKGVRSRNNYLNLSI
jgi:hypothetical protein